MLVGFVLLLGLGIRFQHGFRLFVLSECLSSPNCFAEEGQHVDWHCRLGTRSVGMLATSSHNIPAT